MIKPQSLTFRELVQRDFIGKGMCREQVLSKIYVQSGVSRSSVRAALNGSRVNPETARSLTVWAATCCYVDIDEKEMMQAPTKPTREVGDVGKRAEEAIEAAVQRACLPPELSCTVSFDLSNGCWLIRCANRLGGPDNEQTHPELTGALIAVVDQHYGRRSA